MRLLALLGWIAFVAVGSECDIISPETMERMCRESEAKYKGPPMPRIGKPSFSGRGCPSPESRLAYNYVDKWRCGPNTYDAQFVMPGVDLRAENGGFVKAECAITFHVEGLGEGYQVAVGDAILGGNIEGSPGTGMVTIGASTWEGGHHDVGTELATPWFPDHQGDMQRNGVTISFGNSLGNFSPCSRANGDVGNLTLKYNFTLMYGSSFWHDKDLETGDDVDDLMALSIKWLIRPCH